VFSKRAGSALSETLLTRSDSTKTTPPACFPATAARTSRLRTSAGLGTGALEESKHRTFGTALAHLELLLPANTSVYFNPGSGHKDANALHPRPKNRAMKKRILQHVV